MTAVESLPRPINRALIHVCMLQLERELQEKSVTKKRAISKRDMAAAMKKKGITAKKTVFSEAEVVHTYHATM